MTGMATVVAFHAHPDDEVLLTGGTLARLAAEGHRTVVVVACCGGLGARTRRRASWPPCSGHLFRLLVRLPVSLFGLVAGREWFAEPGAESARPIGDVLQPAVRAEGTVRR
jgi:GlcNAc-PI de-N-acetylase